MPELAHLIVSKKHHLWRRQLSLFLTLYLFSSTASAQTRELDCLFERHREADKAMEKSSRQNWAPPVIEVVLLLRAAVKGGGKKQQEGFVQKEFMDLPGWSFNTSIDLEGKVLVLLQYDSGGCSSTQDTWKNQAPPSQNTSKDRVVKVYRASGEFKAQSPVVPSLGQSSWAAWHQGLAWVQTYKWLKASCRKLSSPNSAFQELRGGSCDLHEQVHQHMPLIVV